MEISRKTLKLGKIDTRSLLIVALILALTAASAYLTHQKFIVEVNQSRLQELSQVEAEQRANNVSIFLTEKQKQLNLFSARASMVAVASAGSKTLTSTVLESLQSVYPTAISTRLFGLDRRELLRTDEAPLSFIEQDMINRAERREVVPAEAIRSNGSWHLSFIAPIAAEETSPVVGTLLIVLPAQPLFQRLDQLQPQLGETRLLRKAAGKTVVIHKSGQGKTDAATVTADIKGSGWQVQFTPAAAMAKEAATAPWMLFAIHLMAAALLIFVALRAMKWSAQRAETRAAVAGDAVTARAESSEAILEVEIASEDSDILQLEEQILETPEPQAEAGSEMEVAHLVDLPEQVFRAYDIRGIAGDQLTPEFAKLLGQAMATEALASGETALFVARDCRAHSASLCEALVEGVVSTGCDALMLGEVPTPLLYFATCEMDGSSSGVVVTASHNSAEYNGFKMVLQGKTLVAEDVQRVKQRMYANDFFHGAGQISEMEIIPQYIDRIFADVALAGSVKLVIDAGNGVTGRVAPLLFEELGCEVEPLYCEPDGSFPNHDPDPTIIDNLGDLIAAVKETGADLGVALDGDGDRLVVVTPRGEIIWPDRLLMLFAKDIVSGNPGADVIFDIKSTRELNSLVSSYGGRPIIWKSGHSNMKTKMQETGALVGGEMSGHIFIKDRWYGFDDGMYAAARLLEIMTLRDQDIDALFDAFPSPPSTPELKIDVQEDEKFRIMERIKNEVDFEGATINDLDGIRVEFAHGWGLVRASNTSPALTLRFEADTNAQLEEIQTSFRQKLLQIDSSLNIPF